MSKRILRVNSLIKEELGRLILKEIEFFPNALVTLTRVETTADLQESNVFVSVIPSDQIEKIVGILNKNIYFLQQKLNQRLRMRPIPKIRFVEEKNTAAAGEIEEILEQLKKEEK